MGEKAPRKARRMRAAGKLRQDFAHWMLNNLAYQASVIDAPVCGKTGDQAHLVDVRGEAYALAWRHLRSLALFAFIGALVTRTVVHVAEGEAPILPNSLLYFAIVAYVASQLGRLRTRRYTWVQCSDRKRPVSREDILALSESIKAVRASARAKWKPAHVLFVAGVNGFGAGVVAFAQSMGIECYRRTEFGFDRVT